ncbi:hypothetical protein N7523_007578 [Penicillium sp. IBT 18751x]|nr:hypothetical protein N7523_007578 [Penicillium sp. IBT 18751x]
MKAFFALTLAALCQSAYCLREGTYFIGSASKVLTESMQEHGKPLSFEAKKGQPGQIWSFTPQEGGYFEVQNNLGGYINCGNSKAGATCFAGERPQSFLPEYQGGDSYELVEAGSGYFLRVAENGQLMLAEYDGGESEQFNLVRA